MNVFGCLNKDSVSVSVSMNKVGGGSNFQVDYGHLQPQSGIAQIVPQKLEPRYMQAMAKLDLFVYR